MNTLPLPAMMSSPTVRQLSPPESLLFGIARLHKASRAEHVELMIATEAEGRDTIGHHNLGVRLVATLAGLEPPAPGTIADIEAVVGVICLDGDDSSIH